MAGGALEMLADGASDFGAQAAVGFDRELLLVALLTTDPRAEHDLLGLCRCHVSQLYRDGRIYDRPVPQPLPRWRNREAMLAEQEATLNRILAEVDDEETGTVAGATAPLDHRRLRGIPAVGRGTSGAVFGTDPLRALIAKEWRRRKY